LLRSRANSGTAAARSPDRPPGRRFVTTSTPLDQSPDLATINRLHRPKDRHPAVRRPRGSTPCTNRPRGSARSDLERSPGSFAAARTGPNPRGPATARLSAGGKSRRILPMTLPQTGSIPTPWHAATTAPIRFSRWRPRRCGCFWPGANRP